MTAHDHVLDRYSRRWVGLPHVDPVRPADAGERTSDKAHAEIELACGHELAAAR